MITAEDRELLDPVLGDEWMINLALINREAWEQTGRLIVRAFEAGKASRDHDQHTR